MKIKVKLSAYLKDYLPPNSTGDQAELELDDTTTTEDLVRYLNIPENTSKIVFVNGIQLEKTQVLKDGDVVNIFPPIAGG